MWILMMRGGEMIHSGFWGKYAEKRSRVMKKEAIE